MSKCMRCGREVRNLTEHSMTGEKLCLRCMTKSGIFQMSDDRLLVFKDERRDSLRIPIMVSLSFFVYDPARHTTVEYPAFGVNISRTGICFTWDACSTCTGYAESGVDPNCTFYTYFISNPEPRTMRLQIRVTKTHVMTIEAYSVYTMKDPNLNVEYVGAQFTNLSSDNELILERMLVEYGVGKQQGT